GRRTRCGSSYATAGSPARSAGSPLSAWRLSRVRSTRRCCCSWRSSSSSSIAASYGKPGKTLTARRNEIPGTPVVESGPSSTDKEDPNARQATKRQEREAVREAQGQGDVEAACGEDRQLARRLEPRRQVIRLQHAPWQLQPGRNDRSEEGRRAQGRPRHRAQELTHQWHSSSVSGFARDGAPRRRRPVTNPLSDGYDVPSLGALLALGRLELDARALGERLEALGLDRAEVDEHVLAALVRGDEAIPLRVVEPFHGSCCHIKHLPPRTSERTGGANDARPVLALVLVPDER